MTVFQQARRLTLSLAVACGIAPPVQAAATPALQTLPAATGTPSNGLPLAPTRRHAGKLPVVAVVGQHDVVLSDFVVPYGVLAQSGAAKVLAVNMVEGPLRAGPVTIVPDMSAAEFDRAYPEGADYVIVPATVNDPAKELAWLREQRARGAALVAICDGVKLLADIGALDGRQATGHWASLADRKKHHPEVQWLSNRRYVADGDVASSAGVSASLPIGLALVETLAGPQAAHDTAARLGVTSWSSAHHAEPFKLLASDMAVHEANMEAPTEIVSLQIQPGDDEVALALHADAWSRTMRNQVHVVSEKPGEVRLRGGLRVLAQAPATIKPDVRLVVDQDELAGRVLSADLDRIARRYGDGTARHAALGLEYPWGDLAPRPATP